MRRTNALQRDPNLAKAFDNIASMFAPPSGSDYLASAKMQSERADAARRAAIFSNPDAAAAAELAARMGYVDYGKTRSGFDKSDATVRFNNAADNTRQLDQTRLQQEGELARLYATPRTVGQGQTMFVPEQTQRATGFAPTMMGIQERDPGKAYALPDGTTAMGPAAALSVDQAKAAALERARAAGQVTDQQVVDVILDKTVQARGPDGRDRFVAPGAAVREGMSPVPPASAGGARKDGMAVLPDGRRAPVTRAPDGLQWQMQDGTPVPPEAQVFDMAKPTGTNEQLGITSSNVTAANKLQAAVDAADLTVKNMRQILAANPNVAGIPGRVKGVLQSLSSSAEQTFKAFAAENPNAPISLSEANALLQRAAGGYDPNIVRLQSGIMDLAYARAQIANPSGEVSRQAFERALESFGQTFLSSQKDLETGLSAFEQDSLNAARAQIQSLRRGNGGQPGVPAPAAPAAPAREERWERGPDGKLRPAQ
jgi:hypothetical protein